MPSLAELGKLTKAKYPGTYDDISDAELGAKVKEQFPGAYDDFSDEQKQQGFNPGFAGTGFFGRAAGFLLESPKILQTNREGAYMAKQIQDRLARGEITQERASQLLQGLQVTEEQMQDVVQGPKNTRQLIGGGVQAGVDIGTLLLPEIAGARAPAALAARGGLAQRAGLATARTLARGATALPAVAARRTGVSIAQGDTPEETFDKVLSSGTLGESLLVGNIVPAASRLYRAVKGTASGIKGILSPDMAQSFVKAVKPQKVREFLAALKTAEDDLVGAAGKNAPKSLSEANTAVQNAKKSVWAQFKELLGPRAKEQGIIGDQIADAIESGIDKRIAQQQPGVMARIKALADSYRGKVITLEEAEEFLQSANRELDSFYAKNQNGPAVTEAIAREAGALRDQLYSTLDILNSVDEGTARALKLRYGALIKLGKDITKRLNVVERANPATLQETINYPFAVARGATSLLRGDVLGAVEGVAQATVAKQLRNLNSSDQLIARAFSLLSQKGKDLKPLAKALGVSESLLRALAERLKVTLAQ